MSAVARNAIKSPYPYFGGKSKVADVAWRAFGADCPNYVEPFFGSGAVLLARPGGAGKIETINDADGMICNFWRSIQQVPGEVARWCDWPVNECDLHPRHRWLIEQRKWLTKRLIADADFCVPKIAGWWVWGASMWIGGGWCSDRYNRGQTRPSMKAQGVHVSQRRPDHRLPDLYGSQNRDHAPPCEEWFAALQERLRRVRLCCGDWSRVLGNSVIGTTRVRNNGMVPCAIFLDPPYSDEIRAPECYAVDDGSIAQLVAQWAREHGDDPDLHIALCGYAGEHEMPGWTEYAWRGARGYSKGNNREKERIWFSPHCLPLEPPANQQLTLAV